MLSTFVPHNSSSGGRFTLSVTDEKGVTFGGGDSAGGEFSSFLTLGTRPLLFPSVIFFPLWDFQSSEHKHPNLFSY